MASVFDKRWNMLLFALCLLSFVCLEACIYFMHCACLEREKIDFVMVGFMAYRWRRHELYFCFFNPLS